MGQIGHIAIQRGHKLDWNPDTERFTNDDEAINTARLKVQDEVVREQVALHPGVVFVDTWALFSNDAGEWVESIIDPRDGEGKDVRRNDGFHLNEAGAEILAWKVEQVVLDELRARGAEI